MVWQVLCGPFLSDTGKVGFVSERTVFGPIVFGVAGQVSCGLELEGFSALSFGTLRCVGIRQVGYDQVRWGSCWDR